MSHRNEHRMYEVPSRTLVTKTRDFTVAAWRFGAVVRIPRRAL